MGDVSEEQKKLVDAARLVGMFMGRGFQRKDDDFWVPASEGHWGVVYLDAVILRLGTHAGSE